MAPGVLKSAWRIGIERIPTKVAIAAGRERFPKRHVVSDRASHPRAKRPAAEANPRFENVSLSTAANAAGAILATGWTRKTFPHSTANRRQPPTKAARKAPAPSLP